MKSVDEKLWLWPDIYNQCSIPQEYTSMLNDNPLRSIIASIRRQIAVHIIKMTVDIVKN